MEVSNVRTESVPAPTASQVIIAEALKSVTVKDSRGRSIEVRRPSNVTRRNARKAISAESQTKPELFGEYMLAFLVMGIDGDKIAMPTNEMQTESVQDRLGDEGLFAVAKAIKDNWSADAEDVSAEAKNS